MPIIHNSARLLGQICLFPPPPPQFGFLPVPSYWLAVPSHTHTNNCQPGRVDDNMLPSRYSQTSHLVHSKQYTEYLLSKALPALYARSDWQGRDRTPRTETTVLILLSWLTSTLAGWHETIRCSRFYLSGLCGCTNLNLSIQTSASFTCSPISDTYAVRINDHETFMKLDLIFVWVGPIPQDTCAYRCHQHHSVSADCWKLQ